MRQVHGASSIAYNPLNCISIFCDRYKRLTARLRTKIRNLFYTHDGKWWKMLLSI